MTPAYFRRYAAAIYAISATALTLRSFAYAIFRRWLRHSAIISLRLFTPFMIIYFALFSPHSYFDYFAIFTIFRTYFSFSRRHYYAIIAITFHYHCRHMSQPLKPPPLRFLPYRSIALFYIPISLFHSRRC